MTAAPTLVALKRPPSDLAQRLREMAEMAEAGALTELVAIYVQDDTYQFVFGASRFNSIGMAAMLQDEAVRNMRE